MLEKRFVTNTKTWFVTNTSKSEALSTFCAALLGAKSWGKYCNSAFSEVEGAIHPASENLQCNNLEPLTFQLVTVFCYDSLKYRKVNQGLTLWTWTFRMIQIDVNCNCNLQQAIAMKTSSSSRSGYHSNIQKLWKRVFFYIITIPIINITIITLITNIIIITTRWPPRKVWLGYELARTTHWGGNMAAKPNQIYD